MAEYGDPRELDALRGRLTDELTELYSADRMEMQRYEALVSSVHSAESLTDLRRIILELPEDRQTGLFAPVPLHQHPNDSPARYSGGSPDAPRLQGPAEVREEENMVGFFSGASREGEWMPARKSNIVDIFAGHELDYRDAIFPPGVTEINAVCVFGGLSVKVPEGINLDVNGVGIFGGFSARNTRKVDPALPTLRIRGVAIFGGVAVERKVRD